MAETDDQPALSQDTIDMIEGQVKKGKARRFFLIYKGATIKTLVVFKKGAIGPKVVEAKKNGFKGEVACGVVSGSGKNLFFYLPGTPAVAASMKLDAILEKPPTKKSKLREFLNDNGLNFKPSYHIITQVSDAPDPESESDIPTAPPPPGSEVGDDESTQQLNPEQPPGPAALPAETAPEAPNADDALKKTLQQALSKLVPQLQNAVAKFPDRKTEILSPIAVINKQLQSNDLESAKAGLVTASKNIKNLLASNAANPPSTSDKQEDSESGNLKQAYDALFAECSPIYDQVLKLGLGDVGKFRAVMAFATEKASNSTYADAIKALQRLKPSLENALSETRESSMGIESGIVAKRKFMIERMRAINTDLQPLFSELLDAIIEENADEDPQQLILGFEQALQSYTVELQNEIDNAINSGSMNSITGLKDRVLSNELVSLLVENPLTDGTQFRDAFIEALEEIESNLTSTS